jgi:hypothetical protein
MTIKKLKQKHRKKDSRRNSLFLIPLLWLDNLWFKELNKKYQINIATWKKLKWIFNYAFGGIPFIAAGLVLGLFGIMENLSWLPGIIIALMCYLTTTIIFHRYFLLRSKYTAILLMENIILITAFFIVVSDACIYRLAGMGSFYIQNSILFILCIFICRYYYGYWNRVWDGHEKHNETVVMDLENGRFDIVNNFNWSEDKVKKAKGPKYYNPAVMALIPALIPISVAIPIVFGKFGNRSAPIIIAWVLSFPMIFFFFKADMAAFLAVKKLFYYEKKIGKPIINGLLDS